MNRLLLTAAAFAVACSTACVAESGEATSEASSESAGAIDTAAADSAEPQLHAPATGGRPNEAQTDSVLALPKFECTTCGPGPQPWQTKEVSYDPRDNRRD